MQAMVLVITSGPFRFDGGGPAPLLSPLTEHDLFGAHGREKLPDTNSQPFFD